MPFTHPTETSPASPTKRHILTASLLLAVGLSISAIPARADIASDQATIDRLIQQGKFDHAEFLCREQLQGKITAERHTAFTVELLRVLTEKARQSTILEADAIFRQSQNIAQNYLQSASQNGQRWLVEFQLALLPRLRGDLRQWQMGGVRGDTLHLRYLRDSLKQLQALAKRLAEEDRKPRGQRNRNGLSAKAMRELQGRVALEIGKTYRAQAEAYPPGSDDRSLAAAEGERVLDRVAPTAMTPEWWWRSRMELLACLRLKADWVASQRRFEVIKASKMPPGGAAELRAESIRGALARKDWRQTKSLVAASVPAMDLRDPALKVAADELGLAYVEAYLALATHAQQSGDSTAARDYETRAAAAVDARVNPSPYWTRRVESLLARGAGTPSTSSSGFPLTVRAARGLFRQGKLSESAKLYERAAEQAASSGDRNQSLSLAMTAAGLWVKADDTTQAAALLRTQAVKHADLPPAPSAHLLAIKLSAPTAKEAPKLPTNNSTAAKATEYQRLLDEHLKWWQQGKTAEQVTWWRGRTREHAGEYQAALDDYVNISHGFRDHESVVTAIERCANQIVAAQPGSPTTANTQAKPPTASPRSALARATDKLVQVALSNDATDRTRDAAAVSAVRIALLGAADRLPASVGALEARMRQRSQPTQDAQGTQPGNRTEDNWDAARFVLAEGLYRTGRKPAASEVIAKVTSNASAEQWLRTLLAAQPSASASPRERAETAAWRRTLVELGESATVRLDAPQKLAWERAHVSALMDSSTAATNRIAAQKMPDLLRQLPKDAEVREWNARLLSSLSEQDATQRQPALTAWRAVVAGSPPQSPRWYQAKFALAQLHFRSGDTGRAAQIIELLQALHPDLGGPEQRDAFLALLKQCRQAAALQPVP